MLAHFTRDDRSGSTFERVDLKDARFDNADLSGAEVRAVDLSNARFRGRRPDSRVTGPHTKPVEGRGWPESRSYPVRECLLVILNEEWEHRLYAELDLDVLEDRST